MLALLLVPTILQAAAMAVDEGVFHRRRGLPRWERIGHPLDTLTVAVCFLWLVIAAPTAANLAVFAGLAIFSCLFITKDEPVHARACSPGEHWLHAVLFVLHPIVLAAWAAIWWLGLSPTAVAAQLALTLAFAAYQVLFWNFLWKQQPTPA